MQNFDIIRGQKLAGDYATLGPLFFGMPHNGHIDRQLKLRHLIGETNQAVIAEKLSFAFALWAIAPSICIKCPKWIEGCKF
jgi:hypothetical protein